MLTYAGVCSYVDGVRTPFLGEPNHANVTLFMTKSLSDEVEVTYAG
jgi:hypothetical protein